MTIYGVKRAKYRNKLNKLHGISMGGIEWWKKYNERAGNFGYTLRAETSRGLWGPCRPPRTPNYSKIPELSNTLETSRSSRLRLCGLRQFLRTLREICTPRKIICTKFYQDLPGFQYSFNIFRVIEWNIGSHTFSFESFLFRRNTLLRMFSFFKYVSIFKCNN